MPLSSLALRRDNCNLWSPIEITLPISLQRGGLQLGSSAIVKTRCDKDSVCVHEHRGVNIQGVSVKTWGLSDYEVAIVSDYVGDHIQGMGGIY